MDRKKAYKDVKKKHTKTEKKGNYMLLGMTLGTVAGAVVGVFNVHNLIFIPIGLLIGFGFGISIEKGE